MKRRDYATAPARPAASGFGAIVGEGEQAIRPSGRPAAKFRLRYAPHVGQFRHHAGPDYLDQLAFAAEAGFTAWEDNGMMSRPVAFQERVAALMSERGMTMGLMMGYGSFSRPSFARPTAESRRTVMARLAAAAECAKRVHAKWISIVPGARAADLSPDCQKRNAIEMLKRCAVVFERKGLVMALAPWPASSGTFLTSLAQAAELCRAVDSPACKVVADLRLEQVAGGNIHSALEHARSEIAYLQVADLPGRCEPGSGEVDFRKVFRQLHRNDYQGVIGMAHDHSRDGRVGERRLIEAYREADRFAPATAAL